MASLRAAAVAVTLAMAGVLVPAPAHAQANSTAVNTLISILDQVDVVGSCNPQYTDDTKQYCCGTPGNAECARDIFYTKWLSTGCTNPPSNVYQSSQFECNIPGAQPFVDTMPIHAPSAGPDFTFYVASDAHPYRDSFSVQAQVNAPVEINYFATQGQLWSAAGDTALPDTPVAAPSGVWFAGDMTTHGRDWDLGTFRLLWEQGTYPGVSINYPVYVGLGNHDVVTDATWSGAYTMWSYILSRMGPLNMDQNSTGILNDNDGNGSHSYSRDWQDVHIVQLGTYAGSTISLLDPASGGCISFPSYVPPSQMPCFPENSLTWLENDLANATQGNPFKPIIIIQHYPWYSLGASDRTNMQQALAAYNVIGIFAGHIHVMDTETVSCFTAGTAPLSVPCANGSTSGVMDEFIDGSSGACNTDDKECPSTPDPDTLGGGEFLTVRVTQDYLDVAAVGWTNVNPAPVFQTSGSSYGDSTTVSQLFPAVEANFGPGAGGCRKRINTRYLDVNNLVTYSNGNTSFTANAILHGPVAVSLYTQGAVATPPHDFFDSCAATPIASNFKGTPYKILNGGNDIPANTTVPLPSGSANLYRLVPLAAGSTPASVNVATVSAASPGAAITIPSQTLTLNGPAGDSLTITVSFGSSATSPPWMTVPASATLSNQGWAQINLSFNPTALLNLAAGTVNALITVSGTSGQSYFIPVAVTFLAPVTVSLTANSSSEFTSTLAYTPLTGSSEGQTTPDGAIQLDVVSLDVNGNPVNPQILSQGFVNNSSDCPYPNNEVLFGYPGTSEGGAVDGQHCPSFTGTNTGGPPFYSFPTKAGLYYLQAAYTGEPGGGSPGPWAFPQYSPVLPYWVGSAPQAFIGGNNQAVQAGQNFQIPMFVQVVQGGVLQPNVMVTLTAPAALPGVATGTFPGGATQAVVFTASETSPIIGTANFPPLTAGTVAGPWNLIANVAGISQPLTFTLENLAVTEFPAISVAITSQGGVLPNRVWTVTVTNSGPGSIAAPQIDSITVAPILNKSLPTGPICNAPAITTPMPLVLSPLLVAATPTFESADVNLNFGTCDEKALYNVTISVSDGTSQVKGGSYTKVLHP